MPTSAVSETKALVCGTWGQSATTPASAFVEGFQEEFHS